MAAAARSCARLAQVKRHFSSSSQVRKEIQDAYIISAARTPVGVVCSQSLIMFCAEIYCDILSRVSLRTCYQLESSQGIT